MQKVVPSFGKHHDRNRSAPMRAERELYLSHLLQIGAGHRELKLVAGYLLHVVRVMNLTCIRPVTPDEINEAANLWGAYIGPHRRSIHWKGTPRYFRRYATQWFRFLRLLPTEPQSPIQQLLDDFGDSMVKVRGLAETTVRGYRERLAVFLHWFMIEKGNALSTVCNLDVDAFIVERRERCCAATLASYCQALRTFFSWAEGRGLCAASLPLGIKSPTRPKFPEGNFTPTWAEVNRLLKETTGAAPLSLRAKAILLLFTVYGLRNSEVGHLLLSDFDWQHETFVVRRAKRGGAQQFPIQYNVGEAIIRYLRHARPPTKSRFLFVVSHRPFGPLESGAMWQIVGERMKRAGVQTKHIGPHTLRHACASRLLSKGVAMKDIADFLGHKGSESVSIYARYDTRLLRNVADFSLRAVL